MRDSVAPAIISSRVINSTLLEFAFNEPIDSISVHSSFFTIDGKGVQPGIALSTDHKLLWVTLQDALVANRNYYLTVSGISDCLLNTGLLSITISYLHFNTASRFDVLINEVMSDPEPPNIPLRYIELFNRSDQPFSLFNWKISDARSSLQLPAYILQPDSFVILCDDADSATVKTYCSNFLAPGTFPSLNVASDKLSLFNEKGALIHYLEYLNAWHSDDLKKAGGWSLELKDVRNACNPIGNWSSSVAPKGGTPGKINSITGTVIE